jgi:DivIVA domain-containing protein
VLASPDQIRRREFVTTRRGYDPEQVRDYLEQLAAQMERLGTMAREARMQADAAQRAQAETPQADPYEELGRRMSNLFRTAEQEAERIGRESRAEAEEIIREARAEAGRIRLDAQARAEEARDAADRALREARERADRTLAGLTTRRDALVQQLAAMQERLLGVARELEVAIDRDETHTVVLGEAGPAEEERSEHANVRAGGTEDRSGSAAGTAPGGFEELWSRSEGDADLSIPDIPPLDLGWDEDDPGSS